MDRLELRTKFAGKIEAFQIEDFGIEVHLRSLSALERARIVDKYKLLEKGRESGETSFEKMTTEAQCYIVSRGLVDEGGNRIYKDDEAASIADEVPCKALDALSKKILAISGMTGTEEPEKNSATIPSDGFSATLH